MMKPRPENVYWDRMWNLFVGCTKCGPGCDNCWAVNWKKRFEAKGILEPEIDGCDIRPFKNHAKILENPFGWRKPQVVAVAFLSDLFHPEVDLITQIMMMKVMLKYAPQHIYLILTKRPERMKKFVEWYARREEVNFKKIDNIWFGISAENQEMYDKRIEFFRQTPVGKRFLSLEPLLGPIDISNGRYYIDQVIIGAETGPKEKRRMCYPEWIYDIITKCHHTDVPCFVKQIHNIDKGGFPKISKDMSGWSNGISERELAWEK